jgi:hypothetical protein
MKQLLLLVLAINLASCYSSRESRENTLVELRNGSQFRTELLGISNDSLVYIPTEPSTRFETMHYSGIHRVRLHNTASPTITGILGSLSLGLIGAYLGASIDHSAGGGGDYSGLVGGVVGLAAGLVGGAFLGAAAIYDVDIPVKRAQDLYSLYPYCRYDSPEKLRAARGY